MRSCSVFFFQAEDGIRDSSVTGVQTCALPIWSRPPARERSLRVVSCPRSLETTKPPGRVTAPSAYTMPAWGTVTTSPGRSTRLLEVSPVSRIRFRLTVMVFATGGGTGSGAWGVVAGAEFEELLAAARDEASCAG